jgi:hypothetical protein
LDDRLKDKLLFEISQIDTSLDVSTPLFYSCKQKTPDYTEMAACAMILQSFYYGIEKMLILIIQHYDGQLPNGSKWHKDLLDKAFVADKNRKAVFFNASQIELKDYLKFRHLIRNVYVFQLEWDRMNNLIFGLHDLWETIKGDIHTFIKATP